jgi:hypothetical protein
MPRMYSNNRVDRPHKTIHALHVSTSNFPGLVIVIPSMRIRNAAGLDDRPSTKKLAPFTDGTPFAVISCEVLEKGGM